MARLTLQALAVQVEAGGAMEWLSGLIQQDEGVEKLHADLSKTLAEQPC